MTHDTTHHTRSRPLRTLVVAALALLVTACQGGGISGGAGGDSMIVPTPSSTASGGVNGGSTDNSDGTSGAGDGAGQGAADSENYVVVGGARYGADSVDCTANDGGFDVGGTATTLTVDGVSVSLDTRTFIGGVFGVGDPEDPPDTVFVSFGNGTEGQWSATTEVQGFSLGSLSNLSYSLGSGASGDAAFVFFQQGSGTPSDSSPGDFQFVCS